MKTWIVVACGLVCACGGGGAPPLPDCAPAGTYRATFVRNVANPGNCTSGTLDATDVRIKEGEACGVYTHSERYDLGGGCIATLDAAIQAHRAGFSDGKATFTVVCSGGGRCTAFFDVFLDKQ